MEMSIKDFAEAKGLSRGRIHQLIDSGAIKARKVGHQFIIDGAEYVFEPRIGRPFSEKICNAFIQYISNNEFPEGLQAVEKIRIKENVKKLKAAHDPALLLRSWLRNRSEILEFNINPVDIPLLMQSKELLPSGLSSPKSKISQSNSFEGYISRDNLKKVVKKYFLAKSDRPNVKFHVIDKPLPKELPLGYLLSDLADINGPREKNRVKELLQEI